MIEIEHLSARVTLYCGDCREIAPRLTGVDAVVGDPPYGLDMQREGGRGIWERRDGRGIEGDRDPFDPAPWLAYGDALLWGANHFADKLPASPGWLVWDKKLGLKADDFSDCEIAWHRRGTRARVIRRLWNGLLAREVGERRQHPMQKPIDVMRWSVAFVDGETILDPFMGSGTIGIACHQLGRRYIGIEIDPGHFAIACRRIEAALRQPDLFVALQ